MKRVIPFEVENQTSGLLLLLGEELKQTLVSISQASELQRQDGVEINAQARQAMKTIDNILLYQRLCSGQTELSLEPVHVGSTMQEVAHAMQSIMRAAGCRTELKIQHGLPPVDVDRHIFASALQSTWQAFVSLLPENSDVVCQAQRTTTGIRLSLRSTQARLESVTFAQTNQLSAQPINGLPGASTDILVARGLFSAMGSQLSKTVSRRASGFGATLTMSRQLQML